MNNNRRTTLSVLPQSAVNARANSRASLGPSRLSNSKNNENAYESTINMSKPSRMSIAVVPNSGNTQQAQTGRPSIGVSRKSSVGPNSNQNRKSSVAARGSSLAMSRADDPRNINDKNFMTSSIPELINYLLTHSFDHSISPKILTRPSVKDFNNIVLFLFLQIDPNFSCKGKFEDEVITLFKQLKYPYPISKTNLVAAGSPTAWPALLGAIMWLVELLRYDEAANIGMGGTDIEGDDPSASEKSFFSYLNKAYSCFLSGDDNTYAQLEEQFVESFESSNRVLADKIKKGESSNSQFEKEVQLIESRRAYLPELQEKKKLYLLDFGKFEQLIEALLRKKEHLAQKKVDRKVELERIDAQIATTIQANDALKARISVQELSPEDVKRMVEKREKMEETLKIASANKAELERKVFELETLLRDKVQLLDESTKKYNSTAEDLKLIPHTARNARGKYLNIEIDVRAKKKSGVLKTDIKTDIVPVLQQLKSELVTTSLGYREDLVTYAENIEDIDAKISELQEKKISTELKAKRAEELYQHEKDSIDQLVVSHNHEVQEMEARLMQLKETSTEEARISASMRKVKELKAAREARLTAHKRMKRELMEAMMEAITQCAEHREFVQKKLGETKNLVKARLENVLLTQGIGMQRVVNSSSKKQPNNYFEEEDPVEYEQIYLDETIPVTEGGGPANNVQDHYAESNHSFYQEGFNDCDSSALSVALGGLAAANLTLVAKEQNIRKRLSGKPNTSTILETSNML